MLCLHAQTTKSLTVHALFPIGEGCWLQKLLCDKSAGSNVQRLPSTLGRLCIVNPYGYRVSACTTMQALLSMHYWILYRWHGNISLSLSLFFNCLGERLMLCAVLINMEASQWKRRHRCRWSIVLTICSLSWLHALLSFLDVLLPSCDSLFFTHPVALQLRSPRDRCRTSDRPFTTCLFMLQSSRRPSCSLTELAKDRSTTASVGMSWGPWDRTLTMVKSSKSWGTLNQRVSESPAESPNTHPGFSM